MEVVLALALVLALLVLVFVLALVLLVCLDPMLIGNIVRIGIG